MGSVKDLRIVEEATAEGLGRGQFIFSDRYSVFDWGEMPDHIPNKGAAIALLGAYFFEKLEEKGIRTHYLGLVEDGAVKRLSQLRQPANTMEVRLLEVIKPRFDGCQYDYSAYQRRPQGGFLIPLEVIYRNYLPEGSSVFRRLQKGELTPEDLGLAAPPVPGQKLEPAFIDFSTKLEITDRYLSASQAQAISGLSDAEMVALKDLVLAIESLITQEFARVGLVNEDGKFEFGLDEDRNLVVVDVLGTLDECRFTYQGLPVSKEIARIYYRQSQWYQAVEEAKQKDRQHWKEICRLGPEPLPPELRAAISHIYCACTNEVTGREWFKGVPPLKDTLATVKQFLPA